MSDRSPSPRPQFLPSHLVRLKRDSMLNTYLHESHNVVDKTQLEQNNAGGRLRTSDRVGVMRTNVRHSADGTSGEEEQKERHKGVEHLDQIMAAKTDVEFLRKAKRVQQAMNQGRGEGTRRV